MRPVLGRRVGWRCVVVGGGVWGEKRGGTVLRGEGRGKEGKGGEREKCEGVM